MESQDSSQGTQQETQPDNFDDQPIAKPARDLLAKLVPLHPTAEYLTF